jgi:hypothetical protein
VGRRIYCAAIDMVRRDVCIAARRWRASLRSDLLTRARATSLLLNALERLVAAEVRVRKAKATNRPGPNKIKVERRQWAVPL